MKVLYSWLREFCDPGLEASEAAEKIAAAGIEVNAVTRPADGISGVVLARVTAMAKHANADRLQVCVAEVGDGRQVPVVTAATNVREGDIVPLALAGATLAGGMKIKAGKLRGELSEGMFCSTAELGLPAGAGVWVLPPDFTPGADAISALGLDDAIIDYEVPANRGDLFGVLGLARELAAATGAPLRLPALDYRENTAAAGDALRVRIDAPDLCERYAATVLRGVRAGAPSPFAMQRRLLLCGQRPRGLAIDVTNYVLLEFGHPLHAFDFALLHGSEIIVRRATAGEPAVMLDGTTKELTAKQLVIADADRPVALAGVMGCADSGVTEATADVVLESAWFNPVAVRGAARAAKLTTAAAQVFERGADRLGLLNALRRATALLLEHGGGSACRGVVDVLPQPFVRRQLLLRPARVTKVLGLEIPAAAGDRILRALGCELAPAGPDRQTVTVPAWRNDISREEDLIEEIARHYGYGRIPARYPEISAAALLPDLAERARREPADWLAARGWQQVITYAFQSAEAATVRAGVAPLALRNPLSPEFAMLRTLLLPGLLQVLQMNSGYRSDSAFRLFESGRIFLPYDTECLPREEEHLGLAAAGRREDWRGGSEMDFFALKAEIEALLTRPGMPVAFAPVVLPWLRPGMAAEVAVGAVTVGWLGVVAPALAERYHLRGLVLAAELNMALLPAAERAALGGISRQPAVERDLALIVADAVPVADLRAALEAEGGDWLERLVLFDLYRGKPLADGEKSIGFRLLFRAGAATLTDAEVNRVMERVMARLAERFGARIRR